MYNEYRVDYPCFEEIEAPKKDTKLFKRLNFTLENRARVIYEELCQRPEPMFCSDYFQRPWMYFWANGNSLKCLYWRLELRMPPKNWSQKSRGVIKVFCPELMTDQDQDYVLEIIYRFLLSLKTTDYYNGLQEFRWKSNVCSVPCLEQADRLSIDEGRLVYHDGRRKCLLTDELITDAIVRSGGQRCDDNELKRRLAGEIAEYHMRKAPAQDEDGFSAAFIWGQAKYQTLTRCMEIYHFQCSNGMTRVKRNKLELSPAGRESLQRLVGGNVEGLDLIAELLARLYRPKAPSNYLWVVTGRKDDLDVFVKFFAGSEATAEGYYNAIFEKSAEMRGRLLAEGQAVLCPLQINKNFMEGEEFKKVNHEMLKRFLVGEKVGEIDDPFVPQGGRSVFGRGVLMYRTVDLDTEVLGRLPYKVLQIPAGWKPEFDETDYIWIQSALICHGLRIMDEARVEAKQEEKLDTVGAVRMFLKKYCRKDKANNVDVKTMYKNFEEYADTCLGLNKKALRITDADGKKKTMGPTLFGIEVERILGVPRQEDRNNNNRLCFKGFLLDTTLLAADLERAREEQQSRQERSFADAINEITERVIIKRW